jgi:hypothetical protein
VRFLDGRLQGDAPIPDLAPTAIAGLDEFCRTEPDGSPWKWLNIVSDMSVAAAFAKLFWPDLIERDGGIFLRECFTEDAYLEWKRQLRDDVRAIERVMNHVHVYDLFLNPKSQDPEPDAVLYFAVVLAKLWSLRAAEQFGAGRVIVDVLDEEPPGTNPVILLHQTD